MQFIVPLRKIALVALFLSSPLLLAPAVTAEETYDTGTDPTKLRSSAQLRFETLDLRSGFTSNTLYLRFAQPLGTRQRSSIEVKLPIVSCDVLGEDDYSTGDFSLRFAHVPVLTRQYGLLFTVEAVFDSADGPARGAGSNVLKAGVTYARFLPGGRIFAPTIQHAFTVGDRDAGRDKVSDTVVDFYYVPKLPNPRAYATIDPALSYDWESDTLSPSLAVTLGRVIDTGLPGTSSLFVKPSVGIGDDRAFDWGMEVGFKVVGF